MATTQGFFVGETVLLKMSFTDPDSGALVDPHAVTFVSLNGPTHPLDVSGYEIQSISPGRFQVDVDTTGFAVGQYIYVIEAADTEGRKTIAKDYFILAAV